MNEAVQPQAGQVAFVVNERCVNLVLANHQGDTSPKLAVQLYQEGDEDPKGEFACWMPYQSQQAKKDRDGERVSVQAGFDGIVKRLSELETQVPLLQSALNMLLPQAGAAKPTTEGQPAPTSATIAKSTPQITK